MLCITADLPLAVRAVGYTLLLLQHLVVRRYHQIFPETSKVPLETPVDPFYDKEGLRRHLLIGPLGVPGIPWNKFACANSRGPLQQLDVDSTAAAQAIFCSRKKLTFDPNTRDGSRLHLLPGAR